MTGGKFTQNVHDFGFATGRALHRVFFRLATLLWLGEEHQHQQQQRDDGTSSLIIDHPLYTLNFPQSSSSPFLSLAALVETLLSLPNRYIKWWLALLHSDPLHVLVETFLIVMCVALVLLQRRTDWKFRKERKEGAPTEEEEEELIAEWKAEKRLPLMVLGKHHSGSGSGSGMGGSGGSSSAIKRRRGRGEGE